MKTSMIALIICCILPCLTSYAQSVGHTCGFSPSEKRTQILKDQQSDMNKMFRVLKKQEREHLPRIKEISLAADGSYQLQSAPTTAAGQKFIPIAAHILRRRDGSGGITEQEIRDALVIVNDAYRPANFVFQLCSIEYIDSTILYNKTYLKTDPLVEQLETLDILNRNVPRKLNIYFFENGEHSWAYFPNIAPNKQHIMMQNEYVHSGVVLAHELGHWMGLRHTHYGYADPINAELVNGTNCLVAGDFLCDTPADPRLLDKTDSNCQYIQDPTVVDANGDTYNPDPTNLMSYSGQNCFYQFSNGQNIRMLITYLSMQQERGYTLEPCMTFSAAN